MKTPWATIIALLFGSFSATHAQEYKCYTCETGYQNETFEIFVLHDSIVVREIVHDTIFISDLNDITTHFNMSFDEFVRQFLNYSQAQDSAEAFSEEKIYLNYLLPMLESDTAKHRYIVREYIAGFSKDKFNMDIKNMKLPDTIPDSLEFDMMFILQGEQNIANFLKSPNYQVSSMYRLLSDIHSSPYIRTHKVGINFYFPDFSFREKREMAQFIKSVSVVVDSTKVKSLRNLQLYITFDKITGEQHPDYLLGCASMVDGIFLARRNSLQNPSMMSLEAMDIEKNTPWLKKVKNQFYFARFDLGPFPETDAEKLLYKDVSTLMNADYPDNVWEHYLFSVLGLLLFILIVSIGYFFSPGLTYFIHENAMYFFAGAILLLLEIYLLLAFMLETMSKVEVFAFDGNNNMMLLLPLMLMFVIPLMRKITKKKEKP